MRNTLKIGTRASALALAQAEWVRTSIQRTMPDTAVELVHISTKGDRILDAPLAKVGGKGLFVKEIEEALLRGDIDLAVHSMKDVPAVLPEGLHIGVMPVREEARDAFVSNDYDSLETLPQGSVVGTSSLRRKAQLLALRPDLTVMDLRGNVGTRLDKLDADEFDAIILAAAGLRRLGLADRITEIIPAELMLPAVAQGALGIEMRTADAELLEALRPLHRPRTAVVVAAERAFLARLEGGCQVPIGAHAVLRGDAIHISGLIAPLDGGEILRETLSGPADYAEQLGRELADALLERGGREILEAIYNQANQA